MALGRFFLKSVSTHHLFCWLTYVSSSSTHMDMLNIMKAAYISSDSSIKKPNFVLRLEMIVDRSEVWTEVLLFDRYYFHETSILDVWQGYLYAYLNDIKI